MYDPSEITALQQQIAAHRSTLNVYIQQLALHGQAFVPPQVISGLRFARSEIEQKKIYLRSLGVAIDDQQVDFEEVVDVRGVSGDNTYKSQVKLYRDICRSLQTLIFAGDKLWSRATPEYLDAFKQASREVQEMIEEHAIYFDRDDLRELRQVIGIFARFASGKEILIRMRTDNFGSDYITFNKEVRAQISRNGRYKRRYDELVEKIRLSFKAKIS